jgi:hypothetical protein
MRLALSLRRLAIARTWLATLAGRVTLWRTVFSFVGMTPVCTTVVHDKSPLYSIERQLAKVEVVGSNPFPLFERNGLKTPVNGRSVHPRRSGLTAGVSERSKCYHERV